MVSGLFDQKVDRPDAPDAQALGGLQPYDISGPGFSVNVRDGKVNMKASSNKYRNQARTVTDQKILDLLGGLPTTADPNAMFNNQYAQAAGDLFKRDLESNYGTQSKQLQDELNARGLTGGSYDAMMTNELGKRYDRQLADARNQSSLIGMDAYQQALMGGLQTLQGLRNDRSAERNMTLAPFQLAMGYQNALTPLQTAGTNYLASTYASQPQQPTGFDRIMQYMNMMGNNAAALAGSI